jgi:hypothetical protein
MRACFLLAAICLFYAGRASSDYVVSGTLKIASQDDTRIVGELRIGSASDAKKKLLLVGAADMALRDWLRKHAGDKVTLRLEAAHPSTINTRNLDGRQESPDRWAGDAIGSDGEAPSIRPVVRQLKGTQ